MGLKLNLGCGTDLRQGWVNADRVPLAGVDVVCDLDERWPWEDDSVEQVWASDVFEHLRDKMHTLEELWRVCQHGAICEIETPNGQWNLCQWADPTHRTSWEPENLEFLRPNHFWYFITPAKFVTLEMTAEAGRIYWKLAAYKEWDEDLEKLHDHDAYRAWQETRTRTALAASEEKLRREPER